jgi:hypothetical protein
MLPWTVAMEQLELGGTPTDYEAYYGVTLDTAMIRDGGIPLSKLAADESIKNITVKTDGTGDYTNLSTAIASITDSSKLNRYTVFIYEGTYDVYSTLTTSELAGIGIV